MIDFWHYRYLSFFNVRAVFSEKFPCTLLHCYKSRAYSTLLVKSVRSGTVCEGMMSSSGSCRSFSKCDLVHWLQWSGTPVGAQSVEETDMQLFNGSVNTEAQEWFYFLLNKWRNSYWFHEQNRTRIETSVNCWPVTAGRAQNDQSMNNLFKY